MINIKNKLTALLGLLAISCSQLSANIGVPDYFLVIDDKLYFEIIQYIGEKPAKQWFQDPQYKKILVHQFSLNLTASTNNKRPAPQLESVLEVPDLTTLRLRYNKNIENCSQVNYRQQTSHYFGYECDDAVIIERRQAESCKLHFSDLAALLSKQPDKVQVTDKELKNSFKQLRDDGSFYFYNRYKDETNPNWLLRFHAFSCSGIEDSGVLDTQLSNIPIVTLNAYQKLFFHIFDNGSATNTKIVNKQGQVQFTDNSDFYRTELFSMKALLPNYQTIVTVKGHPRLNDTGFIVITQHDLTDGTKHKQVIDIK